MSALSLRENVLVTSGDLALFTKDAAVWSVGADGKGVCNVPAGQFVVMNTRTLVGVDNTNVATVTDPIRVGVSLGDDIRWLGGEEFYPTSIKSMTAMHAKCGVPEVVDLWWKCTECFEDYAIKLDIRDNDTMSYSSAPTDFESYIANARPDCNSCEPDCNPEATCDEVATALVTELQGLLDEQDVKAYATRIYANTFIYCFKPSAYECTESCTDMDVSSEAEIVANGESVDIVTGVPYATPSTMAELLATLGHIKTTLENDDDFSGTVYITKGFGEECCVQLHINTPNTFVLEDDEGNPIAPCTTIDNTTGHTDMCGIRVIAAPVTQDSACLITKPLSFYGREINLYAMSDSFYDAQVEKLTSMQLPQNFGNFVQYEEYKQEVGGQGRAYRKTNTSLMDGFGGLNKDSKSRLSNAFSFADTSQSYVSYHIEHTHPHTDYGTRGVVNPGPISASIYVPECDDTTIASVELFLNAVAGMAGLPGNLSAAVGDHPSIEGDNVTSKV